MTNLEAAKDRLTDFIRTLMTQPLTRLDLLKLQRMESDIAWCARSEIRVDPF